MNIVKGTKRSIGSIIKNIEVQTLCSVTVCLSVSKFVQHTGREGVTVGWGGGNLPPPGSTPLKGPIDRSQLGRQGCQMFGAKTRHKHAKNSPHACRPII